ncbi:MAG: hypothetical protein Q9169_001942 [Polycauliona sp. 2 TL-2023]
MVDESLPVPPQITYISCSGYQIFSDASEVPAQYQYLLTRLRIEQTRLLNWGDQVGLLESPTGPAKILSLNHNLLNDILMEIQAAFRGCVNIQIRSDPFIAPSNVSAQTGRSQQKASRRQVLLDRALKISDGSTRAMTWLHWAMVKKVSFEKLIEKLVIFNDRVESSLDRATLGDLHGMQAQSNLPLLQVTNDVSQLRFLIEALVAILAKFKAEALLVSHSISQHIPNRIDFGSITLEEAEFDTSRSLGKYGRKHVWLEWREEIEDAQYSHDTQRVVTGRVKQLATLLSLKDELALFNAPSCIGYTYDGRDDDRRVALVYQVEIPTNFKYTSLYTLRDMFKTYPTPSLSKRFTLASTLAQSLFYLHAVSWLHKGIRADNLLFVRYQSFPNDQEPNISTSLELSNHIMSGFDYARPDLVDEQSFRNSRTPKHDLYSHPDLLQFRTKRSRKCHDMYSLGLVFIELALWRPIEDIVGIEVRRSRLLEISQMVAGLTDKDNPLGSKIAARMGDPYLQIIDSCVGSDRSSNAAAGS